MEILILFLLIIAFMFGYFIGNVKGYGEGLEGFSPDGKMNLGDNIPIRKVSGEEFKRIKEGKPISMDLAKRVLEGDPDAIAELRETN